MFAFTLKHLWGSISFLHPPPHHPAVCKGAVLSVTKKGTLVKCLTWLGLNQAHCHKDRGVSSALPQHLPLQGKAFSLILHPWLSGARLDAPSPAIPSGSMPCFRTLFSLSPSFLHYGGGKHVSPGHSTSLLAHFKDKNIWEGEMTPPAYGVRKWRGRARTPVEGYQGQHCSELYYFSLFTFGIGRDSVGISRTFQVWLHLDTYIFYPNHILMNIMHIHIEN